MENTNWNYPTRVWFGFNRTKDLALACKSLKMKNPLIVTDEALITLPIIQAVTEPLKEIGISPHIYSKVQANPSKKNVEEGLAFFKEYKCDGIIAFGGGSALDAGKTIAFLAGQTLDLWEFEDIGDNYTKANIKNIAPIIAIPTTAGTGSEVGRASVITDDKEHIKKIIFHPLMLPSLVILDPSLTFSLPKHITAWTGIDAFVHAYEAYCAPGYHPMADGIALEAMRLIKNSLPLVYANALNKEARANMLVAAMMGATAFQKGLGSVHSLAHQLGGLFNMPHGLANSIIWPYAIKQNQHCIEEKMIKLCRHLEIKNASSQAFFQYVLNLREQVDIPKNLKEANIKELNVKEIGELAFNDASTPTNAKKISAKDLSVLFQAACRGDYSLLEDV